MNCRNHRGFLFLCFFLFHASLALEWTQKIKHVVVVMEENRSFDHMFGWYKGVNGLTGHEYNPVNTQDPNSKKVYVDKIGKMITPCDPDHGTGATSFKIFGASAASKNQFVNATMNGFVEWEGKRGNANTNYCEVMSMMTPEHVPVISFLASEYALMDRFFAAHAGPTWPNRLFMLSATSAGLTETGPWYHNKVGQLFPQPTFFDQLMKEGLTWRNYYNDTPWELFLGAIAHHPENLAPMDQFFEDARRGALPSFSWINPRSGINVSLGVGSNDQHPDHDLALGEQYYKDIYEAVRSSPNWNETLMIITYDEHGGFFDHVPTPLNVPPPGDGEKSYPDSGILFDRLGVRLPTILISPWIPKGTIIGRAPAAQRPANNSEYDLTSIMATTRKLFGMRSGPLTKRDAWSSTFEHALSLSSPRTDCPLHTPSAPPPTPGFEPANEAELPVNDLQKHIMTVHSHLSGVPHHQVTKQGHVSEWLQRQFHRHAEKTRQWKKSKVNSPYEVLVQPSATSGWISTGWDVNKGSSVSFNTVSLRLRSSNSSYCLDYGTDAKVGARVGVALCYPSPNPDTNRDAGQQWVWGRDATVRPAAAAHLCLTNRLWEGDYTARLALCVGSVQQHWAWHGPAPGEDNDGSILFGDSAHALGVVSARLSSFTLTLQ